jgi:hypothetical protein
MRFSDPYVWFLQGNAKHSTLLPRCGLIDGGMDGKRSQAVRSEIR